ncbi:hypothetical protein D3C80_2133080 [compost metagenome]
MLHTAERRFPPPLLRPNEQLVQLLNTLSLGAVDYTRSPFFCDLLFASRLDESTENVLPCLSFLPHQTSQNIM